MAGRSAQSLDSKASVFIFVSQNMQVHVILVVCVGIVILTSLSMNIYAPKNIMSSKMSFFPSPSDAPQPASKRKQKVGHVGRTASATFHTQKRFVSFTPGIDPAAPAAEGTVTKLNVRRENMSSCKVIDFESSLKP